MVVFKPLGNGELDRILEMELNAVRRRIFNLDSGRRFAFTVTAPGKRFLLDEGTDIQYGARHLKRAIERFVVQPLSRLIATGQILNGDLIQIDHQPQSLSMTFSSEEEGLPVKDLARFVDSAAVTYAAFAAAS